MTQLERNGSVYAELHSDSASNVQVMFMEIGFARIELRKYKQGLNRIIKATRLLLFIWVVTVCGLH